MRSLVYCSICLTLLNLASCAEGGTTEWCEIAGDAAVQVEIIPGQELPAPTAELVPVWRLDALEDGHELVTPSAVAADPLNQRLAIGDFALRDVLVISLDGEWSARWGQRGQGPGELGIVLAARWTADGTLAVYDPMNAKIVHLAEEEDGRVPDEPMDRTFSANMTAVGWAYLDPDHRVVAQLAPRMVNGGTSTFRVLRGGKPEAPVDTLLSVSLPAHESPGHLPIPIPGWALPLAASSGRGDLVLAGDTQEYRFQVLDPGGVPVALFCRPDASVGAPVALDTFPEATEIPGLLEAFHHARPDRPAAIGHVRFDGNDRLWIQHEGPSPFGTLDRIVGREGALYDVYDEAFQPWAVVRMPQNVRMLNAIGDLVIGLEKGEFDELSVVAYELIR